MMNPSRSEADSSGNAGRCERPVTWGNSGRDAGIPGKQLSRPAQAANRCTEVTAIVRPASRASYENLVCVGKKGIIRLRSRLRRELRLDQPFGLSQYSLGPKSNDRIDSRRAQGWNERRAFGHEQQRDRQSDVDERLCRINFEERLLHQSRHDERTGDAE